MAEGNPQSADPNLQTKQLEQSPAFKMALREAVVALQSGDRERAHQLFSDLAQEHYQDENVWIGLALSSDERAEAEGAIRNAQLINPESQFVQRAALDVAARFGGVIPANRSVETAPEPVEPPKPPTNPEPEAAPPRPRADFTKPRLGPPDPVNQLDARAPVLTSKRRWKPWRLLASFALLLGLGGVLAGSGYVLWQSNVFKPLPFRAVTPTAGMVAQQGPTEVPTLPPPRVVAPPTLTPVNGQFDVAGLPVGTPDPANERMLGFQAVQQGRYSDAIPLLELTTARNRDDAEALYYLGLAYMGDTERPFNLQEAALTFKSLIALRPDWATGYYMLARCNVAQGEFFAAVPLAQRATEIEPNKGEYWLVLAQAYRGAGAADQAAQAEAEAIRHAPALQTTPIANSSGGILSGAPTAGLPPSQPTFAPTVQPVPSGVPGESTPAYELPSPAEGLATLTPAPSPTPNPAGFIGAATPFPTDTPSETDTPLPSVLK